MHTVDTTGTIEVLTIGRISYADGLELQRRLVHEVQEGRRPDTLLLLEHTPVITLGRGAHVEHLLRSPQWLAEHGVDLFEAGRGGDVTFHGPGQIVGYPILDLNRHGRDLHAYLRRLEQVLTGALARFGISAFTRPGLTGVWVGEGEAQPRKIAAIGIRAQKWVSSHGFALNVNTDLTGFSYIVPCGLHGQPVTSMAIELGRELDLAVVAGAILERFAAEFGCFLKNITARSQAPGGV